MTSTEKVFYLHTKQVKFSSSTSKRTIRKAKRRATVAGVIENGIMKFGISECSKIDQFDKKIGRKISTNRAIKSPILSVVLPTTDKIGEFFAKNAAELVKR